MSDIGKGLRKGAKALLDFSTQQRLLEREKSQKLAEKQDADTRAAMLKLTSLNTPAGVAATRGILGDTFDPAQELEYRRLQGLLKPSLDAEQYGILNPLAAKIGLQGQFKPSALTEEKTNTERVRQARIEQQRKDDEALTKHQISKIQRDIQSTEAHFVETLSNLSDAAYSNKAMPEKALETTKTLDTIIKGYADHLNSLKGLSDFYKVNPKYAEQAEEADDDDLEKLKRLPDFYTVNPKYAEQIARLEKSQADAFSQKSRLLDAMSETSKEAQQLDSASGGQLAGNAGENVKRQVAMELIRRNYPQLYAQLIAEQNRQAQARITKIDMGGFVQKKNGSQIPAGPEAMHQTPDGAVWIFENGKFRIVK